jgi:hypothetical protein
MGVASPTYANRWDVSLDYVPRSGTLCHLRGVAAQWLFSWLCYFRQQSSSRCDPPMRVKISVPIATIGVKSDRSRMYSSSGQKYPGLHKRTCATYLTPSIPA